MSTETRRDVQKRTTRAKLQTAAKTLFDAHGYEAATMRKIARVAGFSTGAAFANWNSKVEIYREIYGHDPITPEQGRKLVSALQRAGIEASRLLAA